MTEPVLVWIAVLALLAPIGLVVVVAQRRLGRGVAARLRAIDEGRRCPVCNGTELTVVGDIAHCQGCGRDTNLAAERAMTFDAATIANVRELPRGGRAGPR